MIMTDEDNTEERHFSLEELSSLTGFPRRTIRFYMQTGLVPKPEGANRGAYYLISHLDRLFQIRKWQKDGLGLKRIRELLEDPPSFPADTVEKEMCPGEITLKSHVYLGPGLELVVDSDQTCMSPEELREFVNRVQQILVNGEINASERKKE